MGLAENNLLISDRDRLQTIEVAGFQVRCISSNIRTKDQIDWCQFQPISGIGYEGNLI